MLRIAYFVLTSGRSFCYIQNMRTNNDILAILQKSRQMAGFARFAGFSRDGLKKRLQAPETARKCSLYWQYLQYLDYRAEKKGIK